MDRRSWFGSMAGMVAGCLGYKPEKPKLAGLAPDAPTLGQDKFLPSNFYDGPALLDQWTVVVPPQVTITLPAPRPGIHFKIVNLDPDLNVIIDRVEFKGIDSDNYLVTGTGGG